MRKCSGEFVDNLLLCFPIANELWTMVRGLFGVQWVRPRRGLDMLASWQGQFGCHWNKDIWKVVPHCLMRCL